MTHDGKEFDLELRHLRVLQVLLREHNLTRAAQVLGVTQPALSKTLARLRAHFADPLFVRAGQRMEPTSKALLVGASARDILRDVTSLRTMHVPFNSAVSRRTFSFSVVDAGAIELLPSLIRLLHDQAPNVHLTVMPLDIDRLESSLESGALDFAMGSYSSLTKKIRRQLLWTVKYVGVARRGHPRIGTAPTPEAVAAEKHVLVSAAGTGHGHSLPERVIEKTIGDENITCRVPSYLTAAMLVGMTDAIAILPEPMACSVADYLGLRIFKPLAKIPTIDVFQYWHERFSREPGNLWIREVFKSLSRESG